MCRQHVCRQHVCRQQVCRRIRARTCMPRVRVRACLSHAPTTAVYVPTRLRTCKHAYNTPAYVHTCLCLRACVRACIQYTQRMSMHTHTHSIACKRDALEFVTYIETSQNSISIPLFLLAPISISPPPVTSPPLPPPSILRIEFSSLVLGEE